jgi:plastocyanin domain-containing protein
MNIPKTFFIGILVSVIIGGGAVFAFTTKGKADTPTAQNVSINAEGHQIIDLTAKGGYSPSRTIAKAGVPTTLKVHTKGTFDCSSALVIPSLDVQTALTPSGVKEIEIPPQEPGATIEGSCSMGMYGFAIAFE